MPRTIRRGLVRLQSYVQPEMARQVDRYCAARGVSESMLIKSSVRQYLDGTSDMSLVLRRLARLDRARERDRRDSELGWEAFAVYVKLWFAHTPSIPDGGKPTARMNAESRYRQFVEHVAHQYSGGARFLDDLPRERLADEAELVATAEAHSKDPSATSDDTTDQEGDEPPFSRRRE